jgi:hypothetical protein
VTPFPKTATRFWLKPPIAIALVATADAFFYGPQAGSTLGVFALLLVGAAVLVHPALRHDRVGRLAILAAAGLAVVQLYAPGLLAWCLFWLSLFVAVLAPRAGRGDNALIWLQRFVWTGLLACVAPVRDYFRAGRHSGTGLATLIRRSPILIVPLIGGAIFLALFSAANPLIAEVLERFELPALDVWRGLFWMVVLTGVWAVLRPRALRRPWRGPRVVKTRALPGTSLASVGLSLVVFNLLFALQNGLDRVFLWSDAPLPGTLTMAQYAHRGAYPLIVTALLAGLFVLVALRPGSETARTPWLRKLVTLWVGQNLLLVASSILRTLDYIGSYSLTGFRIAALIWMGLVGLGLILICWRMLREKSAGWLINANVLAAGLVLATCTAIDLREIAAHWNVIHSRDVGGAAQPLDVDYLYGLGESGLVPLAVLEARLPDSLLKLRIGPARTRAQCALERSQGDWKTWTWRGKLRLDRVRTLPLSLVVICDR